MADNVELNAGSGGAVVATDQDVGLAHHQYMKMEWGPDNTQTKVDTGASALPIQDGGNSITVDNGGTFATQASQSGTWNINNVSGTVSLPTGAATAAKQPALGTAGTASADVITVQGIASMTALKVDGSAVTQPVSASSLPLPTGASTAAKQPALGTAGTASADVITVQGITSMTPLLVNASGNAVPVTDNSGSLTVDNGGTFAVQAAQSGTWNITNVSGTVSLPTGAATAAKQPALGTAGTASSDVITVQGIASMTALKVDGSAVTQPVSGTVGVSGTVTVDSELTTADLDTGVGTDTRAVVGLVYGASGGGTLVSTTNPLPVGDNGGSLTVDNAGTFAVQAAQSGTWTVQPGNTANTTAWKVDGSAVTQPVSLASVPSHNVTNAGTFATQAAQSGTWTVQPGNTANTTAWLVSDTPVTSGGCSNYHVVAAASTNTANIKTSAGQVYGWAIFNAAAYNVYVKLHNTSGTPTAGSGVIKTIGVPAGGGNNIDLSKGIAFGTGIGISIVKDIANAGTTAVAASDCVVDIHYK